MKKQLDSQRQKVSVEIDVKGVAHVGVAYL